MLRMNNSYRFAATGSQAKKNPLTGSGLIHPLGGWRRQVKL
jgi:hypothetical protein